MDAADCFVTKYLFCELCTVCLFSLFKKGDMNNPSNYRGISPCDASSKLYSTIINNKLREWVKQNNITGEYEAGFKRRYSTIDRMFTLLACVQKQFAANRKLYVTFIDFQKGVWFY